MKSNEIILDEVAKAEGYHDSVDMICVAGSLDPVYLAMDEYAKQQAIAFAEWTAKGLWSTHRGLWYEYHNEDNPITGDQLFARFTEQQFNELPNKPASHVDVA